MDGSNPSTDSWTVAGRTFTSRLIVGTGKYKDYDQNAAAAEAAGAEIVTVALRRVNLSDPSQPMLVDHVKPDRFTFLPGKTHDIAAPHTHAMGVLSRESQRLAREGQASTFQFQRIVSEVTRDVIGETLPHSPGSPTTRICVWKQIEQRNSKPSTSSTLASRRPTTSPKLSDAAASACATRASSMSPT